MTTSPHGERDPIGSLGWETEGISTLPKPLQAVANEYRQGRFVSGSGNAFADPLK